MKWIYIIGLFFLPYPLNGILDPDREFQHIRLLILVLKFLAMKINLGFVRQQKGDFIERKMLKINRTHQLRVIHQEAALKPPCVLPSLYVFRHVNIFPPYFSVGWCSTQILLIRDYSIIRFSALLTFRSSKFFNILGYIIDLMGKQSCYILYPLIFSFQGKETLK
jgi:hypothetical protein